MTSLVDFAAKTAPEPRCPICKLPADVLAEVHDARDQEPPIHYRVITDWLRSLDVTIGDSSVAHHFKNRHNA